ncbi:MAG: hypothetical protein ACK4UT_02700 [Moraxellaceae bacterium]
MQESMSQEVAESIPPTGGGLAMQRQALASAQKMRYSIDMPPLP